MSLSSMKNENQRKVCKMGFFVSQEFAVVQLLYCTEDKKKGLRCLSLSRTHTHTHIQIQGAAGEMRITLK